jgi:hypothetical protein
VPRTDRLSDRSKHSRALTAAQALQQLYHQALPDAPPPVDPDNNNDQWVLTGNTAPDKMEFEYQEHFKQWFIGQMMSAGVPAGQSLAYSAREKLVFFIHYSLNSNHREGWKQQSIIFSESTIQTICAGRCSLSGCTC